jgi:predicted CopG family antitoxin
MVLVKTLTIREEVYRKLVAVKAPDESFSELFERLVQRGGSIDVLKGLRGTLDFPAPGERESFLSDALSRRGEKRP